MRLVFRSAAALAVLSLPLALPLAAGETGSISGTVKDSTGMGVPGAAVRVSATVMPGGRQTYTSANGSFNFQKLIPGEYKVEAELAGLGKDARQVTVRLDADSQVPLTLVQKATAEVLVRADQVNVDLKSAEVGTSIGGTELKALPLPRSYAGLLQLIPGGAADSNFAAGYFNAGGTVQDNTFLIDGVNITNPGYGYLSIETNELDIAEFSVKRGGINAETRAVGAVVNAVTKSGTNEFNGSLRVEAQPSSFSAKVARTGTTSTTDRYVPAFNLGFPILKDVLFGYGSFRYRYDNTTDRAGRYGELPDIKYTEQEYHAKLTAYPNEKNFISVDVRYLPWKDRNRSGLNDMLTAAYDADNKNNTISAAWNLFLGANTNIEAKYIHLTEQNSLVAQKSLGITPTWIPGNGAANGQFTNQAGGLDGVYQFRSNDQNYKRDEVKLTAGQFLDLGPTQHQIKVGFGFETSEEDLTRLSNGWGAVATSSARPLGAGTPQAAYRAAWYPDQSTQLSLTRTITVFLQDTLTWNRLSAVLGFMVNRDEYAQELPGGRRNNFLTFRFGQEFQPRLGLVYNTELLKGDKVYLNFGKYMDLNQKSSARSLSPGRIYQMESYFDAAGTLIVSRPLASTTGKTIDSGLKPTYMREFMVGYSAPLGTRWSADAYFQYRDTKHFIEDIPGTFPASGPFHAGNLDIYGASRIYRGLTLQLQKRYSDKWALDASYTYSRFRGNFDLESGGSNFGGQTGLFNTSSNLMDAAGLYVYDPNRYGYLGTDRPHVFKLFGSYEMLGVQVGANLRIQSGRAWEARGVAQVGGNSAYRYLEPAGSRRLPTWTNVDLLAGYGLPIGPVTIRLEGRILNLFNDQTTLMVNRLRYLNGFVLAANDPPLYAGPQGTTCAAGQTTPCGPNPDFGAAVSSASPRRFVLAVTAEF